MVRNIVDVQTFIGVQIIENDPADIRANRERNRCISIHIAVTDHCECPVIGEYAGDILTKIKMVFVLCNVIRRRKQCRVVIRRILGRGCCTRRGRDRRTVL